MTKPNSVTNAGRCLCNAVRYRVSGPLRAVVACHCKQCRRSSGHHVAATAVRRDDIAVEGDVTWYKSSSHAQRGFCRACGSNLFWSGSDQTLLSIFAGTLDEPTGLKMTGHIFVADKGDYYEITDGLPQASVRDPSLTAFKPT
jgi:hypothetical protein